MIVFQTFIKSKNSQCNEIDLSKVYFIQIKQFQAFPMKWNKLFVKFMIHKATRLRNLDLFLDEQDNVKSRGRIGKTQFY